MIALLVWSAGLVASGVVMLTASNRIHRILNPKPIFIGPPATKVAWVERP